MHFSQAMHQLTSILYHRFPAAVFLRILLLFIFILLVESKNLRAQVSSIMVKGQVMAENRDPLGAATIFLISETGIQKVSTVSDSSGHFLLAYTVSGNYRLVVSHTGYETYRSPLFLPADRDLGLINLIPVTTDIKEVAIQSSQNLITLDAGSIVYNVAKSIDAQGVSAFDVLKKAPGVFIDNDNVISLNGKQGALIMLDGKQTYLSGKEMADLLKSMPSGGIRSIELISSPSAKYDAAGSAGIINIKTLKSQVKGFSGTTTTGLTYGVTLKQNQDLSLNYRNNKFNLYGSYNHFIGNYAYLYGSDRIQNAKTYDSFTDDTDKRKKMGAKLGIDYNINSRHTIGLLLNGNFVFGGGITRTRTNIGVPGSNVIDQVLDAVNDYYYQQTNRYNVNLNYKYEDTLGRVINFDADYGTFDKGNGNLQSNIYSASQTVLSDELFRVINSIGITLRALKLDYTTNLGGGKLETGAKYSAIGTANDSKFYDAMVAGDVPDEERSNVFSFKEQVSSGYVNFKKTIGKWAFQGGLRLEHSVSAGTLNFVTNGLAASQQINRNYTNLFPSFSVAVKAAAHTFSLSYSRRIDRPAYQDLNPFVYLLDELSYWQGNPFLRPQLTHRIQLQYAFKSATIVGLSFSHSDDYSAKITDTIGTSKIVMIPRNLGTQQNLALTLTQQVLPAKWWAMSFSGTLYHIQNKVAFDQYRNFNLKQLAARMNLQQTFKLPFKLTGEVLGTFVSRKLTGANEFSRETSQVDLGLQRNLLKDKATLRLVFNDIYKGSKANSVQNYSGFYLRNYGYYESRQLRLNFTYRFANSSVKGPRSRSSALESENGRIK